LHGEIRCGPRWGELRSDKKRIESIRAGVGSTLTEKRHLMANKPIVPADDLRNTLMDLDSDVQRRMMRVTP